MEIFLFVPLLLVATVACNVVPETPYYPSEPCNKTKVINKVPIYELCHYGKIEWTDYVSNTDISDCNLHGSYGNYLPCKSIPSKLVINDGYGYLLFERTHGVVATLSRWKLKDIDDYKNCPSVTSFPDALSNTLAFPNCSVSSHYLTNVRALYFAVNGLIWWLDVGSYEHNDKIVPVQTPRICAYNETSGEAPDCFEFPVKYEQEAFYYKNWLVNDLEGPDNSYFYLFNAKTGTILVFSIKTLTFWAFISVLFKLEPHESFFHYKLPNNQKYEYVVPDGIYNGVVDKEGIYFCAIASIRLWFFPYKILNDPTYADCPELDLHIKYLGSFNENGQSVGLARDNNVIYSLQVQNQALTCFNKKLKLEPEIVQLISVDDQLTDLTSIQLYHDKTDCKKVYFMSNSKINIKLNDLNPLKKNFVIYYVDVKEVEKLFPECIDYYVNYYQEYHGLDRDYREEYHAAHLVSASNTKTYENVKQVKTYEPPKTSPAEKYSGQQNYENVPYLLNASPIYYQTQMAQAPYSVPPVPEPPTKKPCTQNSQEIVYGQ